MYLSHIRIRDGLLSMPENLLLRIRCFLFDRNLPIMASIFTHKCLSDNHIHHIYEETLPKLFAIIHTFKEVIKNLNRLRIHHSNDYNWRESSSQDACLKDFSNIFAMKYVYTCENTCEFTYLLFPTYMSIKRTIRNWIWNK